MTREEPLWPLLSLAELADACEGCARPAHWADPDGVRRWCAACWNPGATEHGGRP